MSTLLKLIIIEAVILIVQIILYFGCEVLQHNFHDVSRPFDKKTPCIPWTVSIYSLWFPAIAIFPIILYYFSRNVYVIYQIAIILSNVISTIVYVAYPTTFEREPAPDTFWGRILGFVYSASFKGINCAPSLHCIHCYTIIAAAVMCTPLTLWIKLLFIAIAVGIIISTQLTKQHVIIDAITALPFAAIMIVAAVLMTNYTGIANVLLTWGL